MSQALVDINVVLDVLLDRQPHVEGSAAVWAAIEKGLSKGFLAARAITTIHYLVRKELGAARAKRTVSEILRVFDVATVDREVIQDALQLSFARLRRLGYSRRGSAGRLRFHRDAGPEGVSRITDPVPDARGLPANSGQGVTRNRSALA
jgi:PIN domain-containing protein